MQPALMIAKLPQFKLQKITLRSTPSYNTHVGKTSRRSSASSFGLPWYITPGSCLHYSIPPTQWEYFLSTLKDDAIISVQNSLHLPMGARIVEFRHSNITRKSQLPADIPIERHIWLGIRDPDTDKRKLSDESKQTLQWILKSLFPLLSSIPFNRYCHFTSNAAADAFATDDTMGIGGWVTIQSSSFWFSQIWNKSDLLTFLPVTKDLQRYTTSWEALAQLCIILTVHQKCETRPGIINIQSGSDNTGAEANITYQVRRTWMPII